MKKKIASTVGSLFLVIYPMFWIGLLLSAESGVSNGSIFGIIAAAVCILSGVFWNVWILVSAQHENSSLRASLAVMTEKAAEAKYASPPPLPPASTNNARRLGKGRYNEGADVKGWRPT